jgi:anaerobic dimethyl sulfoxide reductase subunit B (iron-sulfur subunit)
VAHRRQLAFFVDAAKCTNCKTCEAACKDFHDAPAGCRLRRVRAFESGEFPQVAVYHLSMSCNHCEDPVCVRGCPAGAYSKRAGDGIVVHDAERCIGCRYCTWLCPYGAPQYDPELGRVRKCDLCVDELEQGRPPVCVAACPLRAIEIGWLAEIAARPGVVILLPELPSPGLTQPAYRYKLRVASAAAAVENGSGWMPRTGRNPG